MRICAKKRYLGYFRSQCDDFDIWHLDLKFAPLSTGYVFTKLEVSAAFLFREHLRHNVTDGLTDGMKRATLNAAPYGGAQKIVLVTGFLPRDAL